MDKKKGAKFWAKGFIMLWIAVALFAPFLANEKPLLTQDNTGIHFLPATTSSSSTILLSAPIPYSPSSIDLSNSNGIGPFEKQDISSPFYRHWLGTDNLGRDVLSNLIHGGKTALIIGLGAMMIAALIGILLGTMGAYFGDNRLRLNQLKFLLFSSFSLLYLVLVISLIPWDIDLITAEKKIGLFFTISSLFLSLLIFINYYFSKRQKKKNSKTIQLPIDLLIGRLIEIMDSIPLLFLIISLSALLNPSIFTVIFIIGLSAWSGIARYARAETLKVMQMDYIASSKALGISSFRIILKHILPNALGPVLVSLSFGVSAAILIEATLSFIGMGLSVTEASWGQLIAEARTNYSAWWLAVFPGLAIFLTVLSCNRIGDQFMGEKL